eukprot:TRINITY_DN5837_c3_g1_i1.p1 TRINITY_DN5837_c3_g1~~TRINITY_DN5837_c3_g1_i1.p1  ORF type:complete len:429 (-),score=119.50 TRINITY_DN5837_c3_g1_i1:43-1329(-)
MISSEGEWGDSDFIHNDEEDEDDLMFESNIDQLYEKHKEEQAAKRTLTSLRVAGLSRPMTPKGAERPHLSLNESNNPSIIPTHSEERITYSSKNPILIQSEYLSSQHSDERIEYNKDEYFEYSSYSDETTTDDDEGSWESSGEMYDSESSGSEEDEGIIDSITESDDYIYDDESGSETSFSESPSILNISNLSHMSENDESNETAENDSQIESPTTEKNVDEKKEDPLQDLLEGDSFLNMYVPMPSITLTSRTPQTFRESLYREISWNGRSDPSYSVSSSNNNNNRVSYSNNNNTNTTEDKKFIPKHSRTHSSSSTQTSTPQRNRPRSAPISKSPAKNFTMLPHSPSTSHVPLSSHFTPAPPLVPYSTRNPRTSRSIRQTSPTKESNTKDTATKSSRPASAGGNNNNTNSNKPSYSRGKSQEKVFRVK